MKNRALKVILLEIITTIKGTHWRSLIVLNKGVYFMNIDKHLVDLYKKGCSLNYITYEYYKYVTRHDISNHVSNGNYIVTKKSMTLGQARKYVENLILENLTA